MSQKTKGTVVPKVFIDFPDADEEAGNKMDLMPRIEYSLWLERLV